MAAEHDIILRLVVSHASRQHFLWQPPGRRVIARQQDLQFPVLLSRRKIAHRLPGFPTRPRLLRYKDGGHQTSDTTAETLKPMMTNTKAIIRIIATRTAMK